MALLILSKDIININFVVKMKRLYLVKFAFYKIRAVRSKINIKYIYVYETISIDGVKPYKIYVVNLYMRLPIHIFQVDLVYGQKVPPLIFTKQTFQHFRFSVFARCYFC